MSARNLVTITLLLVVFGSLGVFALRRGGQPQGEARRQDEAATQGGNVDAAAAAAKVLVTYFTSNTRCESCRTIEALAMRAVAEGFPAEAGAGTVKFRVVNTDQPEHEHFVDHYAITNKIVIVSHQREGREVEWTACQDVWLHFDEPEAFFAHVREPIRAYHAGK